MRKVDQANTDAKRRVVLLAALRCLARIGLQRASVKDICAEAGMRSGHLYYYFPSKDAIVEAVFANGTEELTDRITHMLDEDDIVTAIIRIHEEGESVRREWNISPALRLEFAAEATRNERLREIVSGQFKQLEIAIHKAVERGVATGRLTSSVDAESLANAIALIWSGLSFLRVREDFDLGRYKSAVAALLEPWLLPR